MTNFGLLALLTVWLNNPLVMSQLQLPAAGEPSFDEIQARIRNASLDDENVLWNFRHSGGFHMYCVPKSIAPISKGNITEVLSRAGVSRQDMIEFFPGVRDQMREYRMIRCTDGHRYIAIGGENTNPLIQPLDKNWENGRGIYR